LPGSTLPKENYTNANFLAVAIMYLLASFTNQLMRNANKAQPKAIVIDEAWAITSTSQGAKLVDEVARMGRAHNTALLLISQNAGDFLDERIKNSISTKFAFRASGTEIDNVLHYLELEPSDLNREYVRQLTTGECLMKDWSGRVARVAIDSWDSARANAFETNPLARNS
jgi:DNA helicase HerA-like ATPase